MTGTLAGELNHVDVLFVDLPFTTYEIGRRFKAAWSHKQFVDPHEVHLGFRYMASYLGVRGHSANIVFPERQDGEDGKLRLIEAIAEIRPRILGFTTYEGSMEELLGFIGQVRCRGVDTLVCLGGHLATFSYEEILRGSHDLVDVVVLGEGEQTIAELTEAVKARADYRSLPGIAYFNGSDVVLTPRRPPLEDIDRLPFPLLPTAGDARRAERPLFLISSRGCYGRCSFCRSSHFGEQWRGRDASNVVDEIERAYQEGITVFEIVDDNFMGPGSGGKRRALLVAEELSKRRLSISYHVSCRVNDVDEPTMLALKETGLISLSLGVESGVQRILDTFNKNITVEESLAALRLLDRLDIPTLAYIIFFDPYMTLDVASENVRFLEDLSALDNVRFEQIIFRSLIPISGTPLFDRIKSDGLLKGDYLSGHYFTFRNQRVALLAEFMETIDLRMERAYQSDEFRSISGLYESFKEVFELGLADRAIDLLQRGCERREEMVVLLDQMLGDELRRVFGEGMHHGKRGLRTRIAAGYRP